MRDQQVDAGHDLGAVMIAGMGQHDVMAQSLGQDGRAGRDQITARKVGGGKRVSDQGIAFPLLANSSATSD